MLQLFTATFKQRLVAIHKAPLPTRYQLLYKVLSVNRSTYYQHYNTEPANRIKKQAIAKSILQIYANSNKRLGAYKITYVLHRDYGINISVGRVLRLLQTLRLPRMPTEKPYRNYKHHDKGECTNYLHKEFNQQTPNIVWSNDFTYIKVTGKWYYLCIVMDLYSRTARITIILIRIYRRILQLKKATWLSWNANT